MNEDWTFDSVNEDTPTLQFSESNATKIGLYIAADNPYTLNICKDGQYIGMLSVTDGVFRFEGKMDESAAELFGFIKKLADKYLQENKTCGKVSESF